MKSKSEKTTKSSGNLGNTTIKSRDNILTFVKDIVYISDSYLESKTNLYQQRISVLRKFVVNPKEDTNMKSMMVYRILTMLLAIDSYENFPVEVSPKNNSEKSKEMSQYIENLAKNDEEAGDYKQVRIDSSFQKYVTGLGVRYNHRWNDYKKLPEFQCVPTVNLILDPKGGSKVEKHRWIGFRMRYLSSEMTNEKDGWILKEVEQSLKDTSKEDMQSRENREEEAQRMNYQNIESIGAHLDEINQRQRDMHLNSKKARDDKEREERIASAMGYVDVYDVFIRYREKGDITKTYFVTVTQDGNYLLRVKEVKPIGMEEKKNPATTPFPVIFDRLTMTFESDPLGMNLFDILEDKQKNQSILLNLATEIAVKNLDAVMAISQEVELQDVQQDSGKIVKVDLSPNDSGDNVNRHIAFLAKQDIDIEELTVLLELIQTTVERDTATSDNLLGVGASASTLGQEQLVLENASIRHRHRLNMALRCEVRFWEIWFRSYITNYKEDKGNTKNLVIQTGTSTIDYLLDKELFIDGVPRFRVKSFITERQDNALRKRALLESYPIVAPTIQNDPIAQRRCARMMLELDGLTRDEIMSKVPHTPLEVEIEKENRILEANIEVYTGDYSIEEVQARLSTQMGIPTTAGRKREIELLRVAKRLNVQEKQALQQQAEMQQTMAGDQDGLMSTPESLARKRVMSQANKGQDPQQQETPVEQAMVS